MAKVAEQIVEMLVEAGIQNIYAVTGDSLNEINNAVRSNGKIRWVHVRHEETGAYAAAAEAELKGIACCAGSSGPGHVHLINGLYDANRSGASVLALASTCPTIEFGTDYFQETNPIKLFNDCSVYNQMAATPKQLPRMLQAAVQAAVHKKGVGVVGIPGDVAAADAEKNVSSDKFFFPKAVIYPVREEMDRLAKILNGAKKVCIFCGIGAAGAHDEVVQLAEKLKAPVGYSFRAKFDIQYDNPYEVGMTGLLGQQPAYDAMHDAEVLLLLGTDFPYQNFMPVDNTIIQIDLCAEKLGRRGMVDIGLQGDIKYTLEQLLPMLDTKGDTAYLDKCLKLKKEQEENNEIYVNDPGKENAIHPEYVAQVIDKLADDDAIFTLDTGMCCVWGARYLNGTGKRRMLGSFNHGSMANAMPQAIGALLAFADRQVIALCGDGGLSMLLGDLATIVQYKLPVKLVVFNNRSLGMVKLEMLVAGIPDWQTNMVNPDFAKLAEACGMRGVTVTMPEEVETALKDALAYDGPVLLNIFTDENSLALPPHIEFKQVAGFAEAMAKQVLNGNIKAVGDTIASNLKHIKDVL